MAVDLRGRQMMRSRICLICGLMLAAMFGCAKHDPNPFIFADFESDSELDHFEWECHTLFALTPEHATHGKFALKLDLFPSEYPGLQTQLSRKDWRPYKSLSLDIYNPQFETVNLTIRIDDRADDPDYGDRFNHGLELNPGVNKTAIPLEKLITSGTGRKLDLSTIHKLLFFLVDPKEKRELFFDYIRLEK
jgi:hypothetical protein